MIPLNIATGKTDQPFQMMGHYPAQLDNGIPSEAEILCLCTLPQRNPSLGASGSMQEDFIMALFMGVVSWRHSRAHGQQRIGKAWCMCSLAYDASRRIFTIKGAS